MSVADNEYLLPPPSSKPVRELLQLKDDGEPITLTINGKITLPVRDLESFDKLVDFVEWLDNVEILRERLERTDSRECLSLDEVMERLQGKHGIPR